MRRGPKPKRILLVVGRDNRIKTEYMGRMALSGLSDLKLQVMWEDPGCQWTSRMRRLESLFPGMPVLARKIGMKIAHMLCTLIHRGYFRERERRDNGIEFRIENLRKRLGRLAGRNGISILSFSSGGRVSSLLADSLGIERIICIGYPFRNPAEGENPDRYRHLAGLKTPMLIVQGNQDEYGGSEAARNIALSPGIELCFVDATHAYDLDPVQWEAVQAKIRSAMATPGHRPGPQVHA
jgi:hypothetical protein